MRAALVTARSRTPDPVARGVTAAGPPAAPEDGSAPAPRSARRVAGAVGAALLTALGVVAADVPGVVWTHSTPR